MFLTEDLMRWSAPIFSGPYKKSDEGCAQEVVPSCATRQLMFFRSTTIKSTMPGCLEHVGRWEFMGILARLAALQSASVHSS